MLVSDTKGIFILIKKLVKLFIISLSSHLQNACRTIGRIYLRGLEFCQLAHIVAMENINRLDTMSVKNDHGYLKIKLKI